jgi:hypothetical protein
MLKISFIISLLAALSYQVAVKQYLTSAADVRAQVQADVSKDTINEIFS